MSDVVVPVDDVSIPTVVFRLPDGTELPVDLIVACETLQAFVKPDSKVSIEEVARKLGLPESLNPFQVQLATARLIQHLPELVERVGKLLAALDEVQSIMREPTAAED